MRVLKICIPILFLIKGSNCMAQVSLIKLWETETRLAHPECVLIDGNVLYSSLVVGEPLVKDRKGAIAKVSRSGQVLDTAWVTAMNAPKGMGLYNKKLYVTDITKVLIINTLTGKMEDSILVPGSAGLNDIELDKNGILYVSDPELGYVYRIVKGKPEIYLQGIKGANGLKVVKEALYLLGDSLLLKILPDKKPVIVTSMEPGGDGVQPVGDGDFILSRHQGVIQYLHRNGKLETLLDSRHQKVSTADFDYDPVQRILYVPTLTANKIIAYRLLIKGTP